MPKFNPGDFVVVKNDRTCWGYITEIDHERETWVLRIDDAPDVGKADRLYEYRADVDKWQRVTPNDKMIRALAKARMSGRGR